MRVLVDTNVVLDVLLDRRPHALDSARIFSLVEEGQLQGFLCATTITTIDYLLRQSLSRGDSQRHLTQLLQMFDVAAVNRPVIEGAMRSRIMDFEDAVLEQAALLVGAEVIITRNTKDFARGTLKTLDPRQYLAQLGE